MRGNPGRSRSEYARRNHRVDRPRIGKTEHFADVLDEAGSPLFAVAVANGEADIEALLARAESGSPALSRRPARLAGPARARRRRPSRRAGGDVPGLVMRRAADLYPGESKTDRRDAFVLADTGRTRRHQVHWLDAGDDELLVQLRVLNGYDTDLAADDAAHEPAADALTGLSPALERVLGPKLHNAGARDLLARYPTPQALATAGRGRIARTSSPRLAKALTEAVTEALDATVVVPGSVAMGRVIAEVATELERTQQRRERLGAEIGVLFEAHPFGLILGSLPGVGPRTGARMLAEIVTSLASRTDRGWPATPDLPRSPASPAAASGRRPGAAAGITGSRTRCTSPPSPRARSRLAGVLRPQASRGEETQRRSHRDVAATSSWPCSARARRIRRRSRTTSRSPLDGVNSAGFEGLDEEDGDTTPGGVISLSAHLPSWRR